MNTLFLVWIHKLKLDKAIVSKFTRKLTQSAVTLYPSATSLFFNLKQRLKQTKKQANRKEEKMIKKNPKKTRNNKNPDNNKKYSVTINFLPSEET